jgi:hypothetical protein
MEEFRTLSVWKRALAGQTPQDVNNPARGWYRGKRKGEDYQPIAYWYDDDGTGPLEWLWGKDNDWGNGIKVDEQKARELWIHVRKHPISYDTYQIVIAGGSWPDVDPVVAAHQFASSNQKELSLIETFDKKVEEASAAVGKYDEVTSDEQAVQAQTLRAHLLKLHKDADSLREEEKKPYFEEVKAVDNKWQPSLKKAKALADKIRAAIAAYETKKLQTKKPPAPDDVAEKSAPTSIKGAYGKAATVKTRRVVTAITNLEAFMVSVKGHADLPPLLLGLAQKILDDNGDVLGVSIETRAEVR